MWLDAACCCFDINSYNAIICFCCCKIYSVSSAIFSNSLASISATFMPLVATAVVDGILGSCLWVLMNFSPSSDGRRVSLLEQLRDRTTQKLSASNSLNIPLIKLHREQNEMRLHIRAEYKREILSYRFWGSTH